MPELTAEQYRRKVALDMREDALVTQVIQMATTYGWLITHQRPALYRSGRWATATQGHTGWPDLAMVHPTTGRFALRECKRQREKPTADQVRWLEGCRAAGVDVGVWRPWDLLDGTIEAFLRTAA